MERRLAAIMLTDMVGYSRLMGLDEEGTIARQRAHREEIIDPKISSHSGRIVKTTGDGLLVEFPSVVDAVKCAIEVQRELAERDTGVSKDRRIQYRIGINLGDIVIDGDDILGDGVNIAARLESLSVGGGVCIGLDVYNQIRDKLDLNFEELGEVEVKNIARPVSAFKVLMDDKATALRTSTVQVLAKPVHRPRMIIGAAIAIVVLALGTGIWSYLSQRKDEPSSVAKPAHLLTDKPSIAVLPFLNMSGDSNQQHLADGISEDLTTQLSKVSGLFVISRTTAFQYKDRSGDVRQVAKDLGVRYVLEGSVRRGGQTLRVNAQLIDATTGGHLWAETFDGPAVDVFALQDRINAKIVAALRVKLTPAEKARVGYRGTVSIEAYDAFLRAERYRLHSKETKYVEAIREYNRAIDQDPKFGAAYAGLGHVLWRRFRFSTPGGFREDLARAQQLADSARALGEDAQTHMLLAKIHLFEKNDHARAEREARKAANVDPNNSEGLATLAEVLLYSGQTDPATQVLRKAMRLDPSFPISYQILLAQADFEKRHYQDVLNQLSAACRGVAARFYFRPCRVYGASAFGHLGEIELGRKEILRIANWSSLSHEQRSNSLRVLIGVRFPFKTKSSEAHLLEGIEKVLPTK